MSYQPTQHNVILYSCSRPYFIICHMQRFSSLSCNTCTSLIFFFSLSFLILWFMSLCSFCSLIPSLFHLIIPASSSNPSFIILQFFLLPLELGISGPFEVALFDKLPNTRLECLNVFSRSFG